MALALYAALYLQLPTPGAAVIGVMLTANPSRGAILSKAFWRFFGTFVGALASVVMIANFAQMPILFLLTFSTWLAICVFLSVMFRYFRAYAVVLSGYTVALISFSALADPNDVLIMSLTRLADVLIGIAALTVVTLLFQPGFTTGAAYTRGLKALTDVAQLFLRSPASFESASFALSQDHIAGDIERLDEALEFAGVETFHTNTHMHSLRRGFAGLYAALVTWTVDDRRLLTPARRAVMSSQDIQEAYGQSEDLTLFRTIIDSSLLRIADVEKSVGESLGALADATASSVAELLTILERSHNETHNGIMERGYQCLSQINDCVAGLASWRAARQPANRTDRLRSYKDYSFAARNGARTFLACFMCGLFWYGTGWNRGSFALLSVSVVCTLLANMPNPAAASWGFTKGAVLSIIADFICGFVLLPHVTGAPLLMLSLLPFLALAVYGTTIPKYSVTGVGFVVFFITDLNINNAMPYDVSSFLNNSLGVLVGMGAGVLSYRLLLPTNAASERRRLVRSLRQAIQRLSKGARKWYCSDPLGWQVLANQRLQRVLMRLQTVPEVRRLAVSNGGALMIVAQETLRVREDLNLVQIPETLKVSAAAALRSLGNLEDPVQVRTAAMNAAIAFSQFNERSLVNQIGILRIAARFRIIGAFMDDAAKFLVLETALVGET